MMLWGFEGLAWFSLVWVGAVFRDSYMVCINHPFFVVTVTRVFYHTRVRPAHVYLLW